MKGYPDAARCRVAAHRTSEHVLVGRASWSVAPVQVVPVLASHSSFGGHKGALQPEICRAIIIHTEAKTASRTTPSKCPSKRHYKYESGPQSQANTSDSMEAITTIASQPPSYSPFCAVLAQYRFSVRSFRSLTRPLPISLHP